MVHFGSALSRARVLRTSGRRCGPPDGCLAPLEVDAEGHLKVHRTVRVAPCLPH